MAKTAYVVVLQFALLLIISKAESISLQPQALDAFNLSLIQTVGSCKYTVIISTSCTSPKYTRDQISLAFGDAYGNQIYVPRLDDPSIRAFESCSSDTFHVTGPCTSQICYIYLYRSGPDGWIPGRVDIYGYKSFPSTFNFYTPIPNDIWYGFNRCGSASSAHVRRIRRWFLYPILAVVASLML
ncbi:embryo-specific protein ATS3B [Ricinus communis]|uniref:Uncharacterized protein n=1 Tax=Ricinus communis TaxID=3988 RepID=B9R9L6_RICCO|nr:embryo-specific protein ATS3B [Ricinus communis]EEF51493.1 conserved hypothetical protein [Ricinus communis]|eukprot:XP_002510891.1 embryo-specific protein ATS3B [Ricinus communis]